MEKWTNELRCSSISHEPWGMGIQRRFHLLACSYNHIQSIYIVPIISVVLIADGWISLEPHVSKVRYINPSKSFDLLISFFSVPHLHISINHLPKFKLSRPKFLMVTWWNPNHLDSSWLPPQMIQSQQRFMFISQLQLAPAGRQWGHALLCQGWQVAPKELRQGRRGQENVHGELDSLVGRNMVMLENPWKDARKIYGKKRHIFFPLNLLLL